MVSARGWTALGFRSHRRDQERLQPVLTHVDHGSCLLFLGGIALESERFTPQHHHHPIDYAPGIRTKARNTPKPK
jgi:hypothetical protein